MGLIAAAPGTGPCGQSGSVHAWFSCRCSLETSPKNESASLEGAGIRTVLGSWLVLRILGLRPPPPTCGKTPAGGGKRCTVAGEEFEAQTFPLKLKMGFPQIRCAPEVGWHETLTKLKPEKLGCLKACLVLRSESVGSPFKPFPTTGLEPACNPVLVHPAPSLWSGPRSFPRL